MFVLPTFGLGVVASPTVPPGTFDTATLENGQTNLDNTNILTFTVQPSRDIDAGDFITLAGLTGSQTADGSLTLSGAGASVFGSAGSWTQSTGTLVLTVDTGQTLSTGSDTVITFNLTNPATVSSGVSGITLSGPNFTQASISGTFLNAVDTFNVTTRDTEANILPSTPTQSAGEAEYSILNRSIMVQVTLVIPTTFTSITMVLGTSLTTILNNHANNNTNNHIFNTPRLTVCG